MRLWSLVAVCALVQAASASKAWTDFVSHVASPVQGHATNLATASAAKSCTIKLVTGPAGKERTVTANSFVATYGHNANSSATDCKANVFALCKRGSKGTSFAASVGTATDLNPWCTYCLTQGYGTDDASGGGFYLPCGCQRTCVDVSGYLKTSLSSSNLTTCQAYIDQKLVTTCNNIFTYHFVLWPSLLAIITLLYVAYSMAYMSLDMDSLLYTVGSSSKKDQ